MMSSLTEQPQQSSTGQSAWAKHLQLGIMLGGKHYFLENKHHEITDYLSFSKHTQSEE